MNEQYESDEKVDFFEVDFSCYNVGSTAPHLSTDAASTKGESSVQCNETEVGGSK